MARLPQPGGDQYQWGEILNDYLSQVHTTTGQLKADVVQNTQIANGVISEAKLDSALAAKVNAIGGGGGAVTSVAGKTGVVSLVKADVGLANVDNTSDANKPISSATQTALDAKANTNDARFTDQRTPVDNSVTTAKLADASVTDDKLAAGTANTGQFLSHDGTNMIWTTVSSTTVSDATTSAKGIVQLAGDLAGTSGTPTVARVNGVAVTGTPSNGQVLTATGASAASWQAPQGGSGGSVASTDITDSTATGRSVLTAADAAAARSAIGAGTSNLAIGTTGSTAKAGNYTPTKADVGLANADNTSDANKPISSATQTALNGKAGAVTANAALWIGTQSQYNALGSYSATTLYVISD